MILRAIGVLTLLYLAFFFGTKWKKADALKSAVRQCEKACKR